jgi:flagellar hook-associated protein 2
MSSLSVAGLASGFDWKSLVEQLGDIERAPQRLLLAEQTKIQERNNSFGSVKTQLGVLRNRVDVLKDPNLFDSRTATSSDSTKGTVTASPGAPVGRYTFAISQLATTSAHAGAAGAGKRLSETDDVSALTLESAGFSSAVSAGTFTVNGKQVTVATSDTLGALFDKISTATGGAVTGSYSAATDRISLTSSSAIVLGSATDSSNFLQVAKLNGNNATSITSDNDLGGIRMTGTLASANFTTPLTGGTAGQFKINGVTIGYDTTKDGVAALLDRINASGAGVQASYDAVADRFTLSNKNTGSTGIALEDVEGSNFLAASGLLAGSLTLGKNLQYSINGGGTLTSQSNTIREASSGLAGLDVTALSESSFTVNVAVDTAKIRSAITGFVEAYNSTQSGISARTASTTDNKGKVTAGILSGDAEATGLTSRLRGMANATFTGLTGSISRLESLGISSNGYDDALSTTDLSNLDAALRDNPASVKEFFASDSGFATQFDTYLESVIGDEGSLTAHQEILTKQSLAIDTQVVEAEQLVLREMERLTNSFVAMEQAQAKSQQQLQYLLQSFGSS